MLETCAVAAAAAEQGGAGSADSTGSGVQKGGSGNTHKDGLSRPLFFLSRDREEEEKKVTSPLVSSRRNRI